LLRSVGSGAVAQPAAVDEEGTAEGADGPHAATRRASSNRPAIVRRGDIHDSVSRAVGTCRRGRMAAS